MESRFITFYRLGYLHLVLLFRRAMSDELAQQWIPFKVTTGSAPWMTREMSVVMLVLAACLAGILLHLKGSARTELVKSRDGQKRSLAPITMLDDKLKRKMFRSANKDQLACTHCTFNIKDPYHKEDVRRSSR